MFPSVEAARHYCGRHSTPSIESTIWSEMATWMVSAPTAASLS